MGKYAVIDLFAGAGGLSFGFESVGFDIKLAIEKDAWAVETYIENHKNKNAIEADIYTLNDSFFDEYCGKIDIVMGGPPCQGFSIAASNRRKADDSRNELYREFLRVVDTVNPRVVLIENVKEIMGYRLPDGTKIVDDIKRFFDDHGYIYDCNVLNCRNYGIPQDRRRFFFLAIRRDVSDTPFSLEELMKEFIAPELTFNEATSDLPIVKPHQYPEDAVQAYTQKAFNGFQERLRGQCSQLHNHIPMQHTDRTVQKFMFLQSENGQQLPEELRSRVRGHVDTISNSAYSQNHRIIDGNKVSPTITASFYSSFIHPTQPRNITVREAARIQTFPDSFVFKGKKTTLSKKLLAKKGILGELHLDQFNQVGNAVPPLMAEHLARICLQFLTKGK